MEMFIDGVIDEVSAVDIVGKNQLRKTYILITEKNPQEDKHAVSIKIDFIGHSHTLPTYYKKGDFVRVYYGIKYSQHGGKIYNNIKGYRIDIQKRLYEEDIE